MIAFLCGLFFGGLVGFFVASAPTPNERVYKRGYELGLRDFAERAKQNASWPEWGEMHVEDIDDTLKEMLAEMEGEQ